MHTSSPQAIQRYSQYCGPAAASAISGFSREECARALRHLERSKGRKSRASTGFDNLIRFLEVVGREVEEFVFRYGERVTLRNWLATFDTGTWMVVTPGHVIVVQNGRIVEDNGNHKLSALVKRVASVKETARSLWPVSHSKSTCRTDNTHAKMEPQQELSRKETTTMNTILTTGSTHHQCACSDSCPASTRRTFAQGHDARLVSRLRDSVMNAEMDRDEAYAELNRRAGINGLHYKLDNAIRNAMDRLERIANRGFDKAQKAEAKKAAKPSKTERKVDTITVDGFELVANPSASEPNVTRKVGRWNRDGGITEHQLVGGEKTDTVRVFRYVDKQGNKQATTKHSNPS
jgi:hypothetical protein